jgi:hypothetical protein
MRKYRFNESILLGYPIPFMFFSDNDDAYMGPGSPRPACGGPPDFDGRILAAKSRPPSFTAPSWPHDPPLRVRRGLGSSPPPRNGRRPSRRRRRPMTPKNDRAPDPPPNPVRKTRLKDPVPSTVPKSCLQELTPSTAPKPRPRYPAQIPRPMGRPPSGPVRRGPPHHGASPGPSQAVRPSGRLARFLTGEGGDWYHCRHVKRPY